MDEILERAWRSYDLRRYDDADRLVARALAEAPASARALRLRAYVRVARGDWAGARETAREAIAVAPEWADLHATLANAILNDEMYGPDRRVADWLKMRSVDSLRLAEALHHADRAVELSPEEAYVHGIRARVLLEMERPREALAACDAGLAIDATDSTCRLARHDALVTLGRYEEAARCTAGTLSCRPGDAAAHTRMAALALDRGEFAAAFEHAGAALRVDPQFVAAQSTYWTAAAHLGPGVRGLARLRAAFLRAWLPVLRVLAASPRTTVPAALVGIVVLIGVAYFALEQRDRVVGWAAVALLAVPAIMIAVPGVIWAALHVLLIVRRRDRRASIPWRAWFAGLAIAAWVAGYAAACFALPRTLRPRWWVPLLLAGCPVILALLSAASGRLGRFVLGLMAVVTAAFAGLAYVATRAGDREAPMRFLLLAGVMTLVADMVARHAERRARSDGHGVKE